MIYYELIEQELQVAVLSLGNWILLCEDENTLQVQNVGIERALRASIEYGN